MKNLFAMWLMLAVIFLSAQLPQKINYQAVVRNAGGQPVAGGTQVEFRFTIHDATPGGAIVYSENFVDTANPFGLCAMAIGSNGNLAGINWSNGDKYLQVETKVSPASAFTDMGTSQLLSVPYALYAGSTSSGWNVNGNSQTDSTNFVGTTDAHQLRLKVNNQQSGYIDYDTPFSTGFGYQTLVSATGDGNSAFGYNALAANTFGYWNTATGKSALALNTIGASNTATGYNSLAGNINGYGNTATGYSALTNSTGNENSGFGSRALVSNTSGEQNTAMGSGALLLNTSGSSNTATGYAALSQNYIGRNNTAVGEYALFENTDGNSITAVGGEALYNNRADLNTCVGFRSGITNHTGFNNTAIGANSLMNNNSGSYHTSVGYNTGPNAAGLDNTTTLGIDASATATDQVRIGNVFVGSIGGQVGWTTLSDARFKENVKTNVPGLSFITQLRPVTYQVNRDKVNAFAGVKSSMTGQTYSPVTTGFIAQEVESAAKNLGFNFSGVDAPKNENDYYGLRYAEFVVPLVKAVQEQQQIIEVLKKEIEELKKK